MANREELESLSRDDLNDEAVDAGVEDPEDLPNKEAVIQAIMDADDSEAATSTDLAKTGDGEDVIHTSHHDAHIEGVTAGEVTPDPPTGEKPTDGPAYPFPVAGDVDVATIPETSKKVAAAEWQEPLTGGDVWVQLAEHDDVPEELWGAVATVVDAPTMELDDGGVADDPDADVTVKTRGADSTTLEVPHDAIAKISRNGRAGLVPFA